MQGNKFAIYGIIDKNYFKFQQNMKSAIKSYYILWITKLSLQTGKKDSSEIPTEAQDLRSKSGERMKKNFSLLFAKQECRNSEYIHLIIYFFI